MIKSNHVIYSNGELRLKKEQEPFEAPQDDSSYVLRALAMRPDQSCE